MIKVWNCHLIRPTKNQNSPSGRPVVLYTLPRLFHVTSHVKEVDQNHIEICQSECMFRSHLSCDTDIFDLCMMYMVEDSLQPPENLEEALELYIFLRISIHREI